MVPTHSWPSRLVLGVLALQLASACTPDPTPPPTNSDTTPPSTRANPPGGNFTASLTVTLTCDDGAGSGCAATYYTTDGSAPSASSARYSAPVAISKTTTLKYFSVDAAGNAEAAQSQSYVVSVPATDTTPPTVTASPAAGVYTTAQTVTLTCDDGTGSGCGPIHYTTDGSEPTASSPQYSAPLTVSTTTTVRFFATDKAGNASAVASAAYVIDDAGPVTTATPTGGLYNKEQSVTLVCDDGTGSGCAETRYTTDGSAPGASSALYTGPIAISSTTTLKFFSKDKAGNAGPAGSEQYTLDMVAPTVSASPTGGLFRTAPSVTLSCADEVGGSGCASIHYTTDGSTPTASSATYTSALSFSATTTLKFLAVDNAGNASAFQTETYTLDTAAPTTTAIKAGGAYPDTESVSLVCGDGGGSGCTATYYTTDGSTPTTSSSTYSAPISIAANTTLKFFSVDAAGNEEAVHTETYVIDRIKPTVAATPKGGTYRTAQSVTLTCSDEAEGSGCASIHYTTDGSMPTASSATYTSALTVSANTTLEFLAMDKAGNASTVTTETYVIDTAAPTTTASPKGATYMTEQTITLSCSDGSGTGCDATYYTLDGSEPTTGSTLYTAPFKLSVNTTLKFFSTDKAGNAESTKTETYSFDPDTTAPTTTASTKGGTYRATQTVTLACSDGSGTGCDATYYTLDGSEPTTGSTVYTAAITVSANTTLKFFSTDKAGNTESTKTETYVIDSAAPTTTASLAGGTYTSTQTVTLTCTDGTGTGCDATYYTLDGSAPTTGSTLYTAAITVSANATLKFFSTDKAGNAESTKTETYVIDSVAPSTTASPKGGTYTSTQAVTLTCTDGTGTGCAATYYTLDGSEPTTGSTLYTTAITVSANTTLKFFSTDKVGNTESTKTETYVIDSAAPTTTVTPAGGTYMGEQTVTLACSDGTGTGCDATYYTLDGSTPTTGSKVYTGALTLSARTTLKFFSTDKAGNKEAVRTESYIVITPAGTSAQIAAIRSAVDGAISLPVDYAYVTYTKPNTGATTGSSDPAGFFLQAEKTGPAVFVAVDPATLSPVPQVGDRVSFTATDRKAVNGVVEVDALDTASFKVNSSGDSVEFLRTDVSTVDLAANGGADYESKLISISGTVAAALVSAGTNHVSANLVTVGTPTSNNNLKLRITTAVQDAFDVVQNCSVTVKSPMWRFASGTTTQAQASAWANADLTVLSCPAPKVVSAAATNATTLQVTFDRRIDAASVLSNGSQFTLNNGLVANSATATASARQVQLFTSPQVGGSSYQVTVASSVKDLAGSGIDSTANSATFTGYLVAAKLLINEVNPNISSNKDLLELLVVSGGTVNGMTLVADGTTSALATLPNITVATGDILVVHFAAGTGDGPASETTSKAQYPKATYANNYDTAWDVNTSTAGLPFAYRVLRIKDSAGATVDAVPFVNTAATPPGAYPTYLQDLQNTGLWFPSDCGGVACSTNALAATVSVDYKDVGTTAAGKSMQRTAGANTRQKSDWVLSTASSFGVANP